MNKMLFPFFPKKFPSKLKNLNIEKLAGLDVLYFIIYTLLRVNFLFYTLKFKICSLTCTNLYQEKEINESYSQNNQPKKNYQLF